MVNTVKLFTAKRFSVSFFSSLKLIFQWIEVQWSELMSTEIDATVLPTSCGQATDQLLLFFPSPADLQCVVASVYRVQPPTVLPALPSPLLPSTASPLWRQSHGLSGVLWLYPCWYYWTLVYKWEFRVFGWFGSENCLCSQEEDEFASLAACLGLFASVPQPASMVNSASCLQWPVNATDLVTQWCTEVTALSQIQAEQSLVCMGICSFVWPLFPLGYSSSTLSCLCVSQSQPCLFAGLNSAENATVHLTDICKDFLLSVNRFYNLM